MRVYGVVYASMFDENNVFLHEEDARRFTKMLRRRHKLQKNDPLLRIIHFEIHESYDPSFYAPKKIKLERQEVDKK